MYHVIGTGITVLILYLISYIFCRIGYYTLSFHRKLWNSFLAISFMITAIAGVFMALQITYKWDIPQIKQVLRWHVEFGTGMAFTGLLHFFWHLSYFSKLFERRDGEQENIYNNKTTEQDIRINLFITGFVSSSVQLMLIREMMNISGGYELTAGIFLGTWLIVSSWGSALAGKSQLSDLRRINLVFSLIPFLSLFLMFLLARLFLQTGETPSLLISLIYTLIVLIPYCIVSGFTFIKLISIARNNHSFVPGKSFSIETSGGIAAGVILSTLISQSLGTYKLLLIVLLLSVAYVLLTYYITEEKTRILSKTVFMLIASTLILIEPDVYFRQLLLPGINIISTEDTPYGNITIGEYNGEKSLYYNQRLLTYNNDIIESEENIHYAMLQCESPQKVILISGSLRSHLPEILKYPVKKITYIERDPVLVIAQSVNHDSIACEVSIANSDAFSYLRNSREKADAIIMLIPPPSTLLLNRYYTTEFFHIIKDRLNTKGVFICSPGPGETYFNEESLMLNSSVFNTLKEVFTNVIPVAGNKLYFIASDHQLSAGFCRLIEKRGIKNHYVSTDYLADDLTEKKTMEIYNLMDTGIRQNKSAFPIAYSHFQSYYLSKNLNEKTPLIILLVLLFAIPVVVTDRKNLVMYFGASALAGFEIVILLTLQLTVGNMYQMTGLIIAGLMTGLAAGSGSEIRLLSSLSVLVKTLLLLFFYLLIGTMYDSILTIENRSAVIILIIVLSFIPSFLTGNIFRELTLPGNSHDKSSSVYSADLSGSAFGFIIVSGFIIPAFGISGTLYLLAALIFTGILFGTLSNK